MARIEGSYLEHEGKEGVRQLVCNAFLLLPGEQSQDSDEANDLA